VSPIEPCQHVGSGRGTVVTRDLDRDKVGLLSNAVRLTTNDAGNVTEEVSLMTTDT
jgi:hypothetical protein